MAQTNKQYQPVDGGPARGGQAVTPHNTTLLTNPARFLFVGTGGDLTVLTWDDQTLTLPNCPAGWVWVACQRVNATGTTATNIVAFY